MSRPARIAWLLAMTVIFILVDHDMRVDQRNLCEAGRVECPNGLWIWGE